VSELPGGGFVEWIYPRSAIREVVAYAGVALWLLRELRRRTPDEFRRTLWRAPVIIAIANFLLPAPFVLVHGIVQELFAEQAGRMGLRFLVRIIVGYGYVALVEWIQEQVRQDDLLGSETDGMVSGCRTARHRFREVRTKILPMKPADAVYVLGRLDPDRARPKRGPLTAYL
jgi:hypothetical protein